MQSPATKAAHANEYDHHAALHSQDEALDALPPAALQPLVAAGAAAVAAQYPAEGAAGACQRLLATYCEAWSRAHPPLALLQAPGGGSGTIGVVRSGLLLSVLRPPTAAELLAAGRPAALGPAGDAAAAVLRQLRALLGRLAWQSLLPLMLTRSDALSAIVPRIVELLLSGPGPAASGSGEQAGAAAARRPAEAAWRQQRQALLLALAQALAASPDPLQGVSALCALLTEAPPGGGAPPAGAAAPAAALPPAAVDCVTFVAGQVAEAQAVVAGQLLVLAALLAAVRCAGGVALTTEQLASLTDATMPAAAVALQAAAACRWLCQSHTPQGGGSNNGEDVAASGLAALRLGGAPAPTPAAALLPAALADQLLALADSGRFGELGRALAAALQRGAASGGGALTATALQVRGADTDRPRARWGGCFLMLLWRCWYVAQSQQQCRCSTVAYGPMQACDPTAFLHHKPSCARFNPCLSTPSCTLA